ncbi:MAG: hypothetical protein CUN54_06395 [Phototrophicales bacterium]|nr:MAG: hypothetical protein CUN54_06395 [Phototrophicales bacterium]
MFLRVYRVTDRIGIALLKSSVAFGAVSIAGAHTIVAALVRILRVFGVGGQGVLLIFRRITSVLLIIAAIIARLLARAGVGTARVATRTSKGSAADIMARRAAQAEIDATIAEDPLRTYNRQLSILIVVLLIILIGILWAVTQSNDPTVPVIAANSSGLVNINTGQATAEATAVVQNSLPIANPNVTATPLPAILEVRGSMAYVVREKGQLDIWAVNVGNRTPIRLTNNPEDERDPAWSPDGRRLAYAGRQDGNWEIYIYDLATDTTTRMTFDLSFQGAPQWSPDGQWLVYESYQGNNLDVYIVPVDSSQPPQRVTNNPAPDFSPAWSPDGRRIAFTSWRDGNQDIYIFSLDDPRDEASVNLTNTPARDEDYAAWSPDGNLIAYSAVDEGLEKVFVKPGDDPNATAQALERGRTPEWAPDGRSLVFAVDSIDSTHLVAAPFAGTGIATEIIPVPLGASNPSWTAAPLPTNLVNAGGLPPAITDDLFIEQVARVETDPPIRLNVLRNVEAPNPALSDEVNDSFNALREHVLEVSGVDFLGTLEDAFWSIDRPPQPGEDLRSWHKAGRAFAFNRNAILGFPAPIEVVREDLGVDTFWRVYLRVSDDAQNGQLGEPLRRMPWDFASRDQGDVAAYDEGGRRRAQMPEGYYVDLTQIIADYGWERVPAGNDWRGNVNSINYWLFRKTDGLSWLEAMRQLYAESQLGGFVRATSVPAQQSIVETPEG